MENSQRKMSREWCGKRCCEWFNAWNWYIDGMERRVRLLTSFHCIRSPRLAVAGLKCRFLTFPAILGWIEVQVSSYKYTYHPHLYALATTIHGENQPLTAQPGVVGTTPPGYFFRYLVFDASMMWESRTFLNRHTRLAQYMMGSIAVGQISLRLPL